MTTDESRGDDDDGHRGTLRPDRAMAAVRGRPQHRMGDARAGHRRAGRPGGVPRHVRLGARPEGAAEVAHPAVLTCLLLGRLRIAFPVPEPDGGGIAHMHTSEELDCYEAVRLGEPLDLVGRLRADLDRRSFRYEGWLLGPERAPRLHNAFVIRMVELAEVTAR